MDTMKVYLDQIGRVPRLTPEQEIELGRQVQRLQKLYEVRQPTFEQWQKAANLSAEELQSAIAQGERAKRRMIEANLRFCFDRSTLPKSQFRTLRFNPRR